MNRKIELVNRKESPEIDSQSHLEILCVIEVTSQITGSKIDFLNN